MSLLAFTLLISLLLSALLLEYLCVSDFMSRPDFTSGTDYLSYSSNSRRTYFGALIISRILLVAFSLVAAFAIVYHCHMIYTIIQFLAACFLSLAIFYLINFLINLSFYDN